MRSLCVCEKDRKENGAEVVFGVAPHLCNSTKKKTSNDRCGWELQGCRSPLIHIIVYSQAVDHRLQETKNKHDGAVTESLRSLNENKCVYRTVRSRSLAGPWG